MGKVEFRINLIYFNRFFVPFLQFSLIFSFLDPKIAVIEATRLRSDFFVLKTYKIWKLEELKLFSLEKQQYKIKKISRNFVVFVVAKTATKT